MVAFADRVKETSTSTGTGTINLAGAVTGYQTFVAGVGTGGIVYYTIELLSAGEWEVGIGTVTDASPDTLSRTTVLASSNAGALVNFSAGTKNVFLTAPARLIGQIAKDTTNKAFNSDFSIFQRQLGTESTETSYADDAYAWDRWYVLTQTTTVQCSRQDGDRARYAARIKQNQASAQRAGMATLLEGIDSRPFRGQDIRAQVRVKISNSQAVRIAILEWTGTKDSPVSDPVNDWTSSTYTTGNFFKSTTTTVVGVATVTPGAATWTDLSVTGSVSSSCTNLLVMVWSEGTMAQNVTLDVTQVSITRGTEERTWEPPAPTVEYVRCARYFFRWQNPGTDNAIIKGGRYSTNTISLEAIWFPTRMRAFPTASSSGPAWVGAPTQTGNQMSAHNEAAGAAVTITGALTVGLFPGLNHSFFEVYAGTSFSGSAGNNVHVRHGSGVYYDFAIEL